MKFSVLISVYYKEKAEFLEASLKSLINQTYKPNEVVVVKDGKLTKELNNVVTKFESDYPNIFKSVQLDKNQGLGKALEIGIEHCTHSLIARMDSDDISLPDRFEKQINVFEESPDIDLVGGWISEFEGDESNIYAFRKVPQTNKEIYDLGKKRNPINHVTVMFKKDSVLKADSYKHFPTGEDYYLWVRMLVKGLKLVNIPEVLVNVRAGRYMQSRRGGLAYLKHEIKLQKVFYKLGYINSIRFFINIIVRFIVRLLPSGIRSVIYFRFTRVQN